MPSKRAKGMPITWSAMTDATPIKDMVVSWPTSYVWTVRYMLEDARLIREGLWRMVCCTQDAAESLDLRIEDEALTLGRRSWRFAKPWNACRPSASK